MPLDQRAFIQEEIKREEEAAKKSTPTYVPPKKTAPPAPAKPKRKITRGKNRVTVKKGQTYDTIAKDFNLAPADIINAPGNPKNIRPGIVVNVPSGAGPVSQGHGTTQIQPQPQVPNLPGYGGTVADYRAAGANVPGQTDVAAQERFKLQERQSEEDNWYMKNAADIRSAFRSLSPLAKGPKAEEIRDRYRRLQEAQERMEMGGTSHLDYLFGGFNPNDLTAAEWLKQNLTAGPAPGRIQGPADFAERQAQNQMLTGQGSLDMAANWFQKFMGERFNPDYQQRTPETWGDVRAQQAMQRRGDAMQDYYSSRPTGVGGTGQTAAQDDYPDDPYRNPAYENTGADMPGVYDIDYRGPNGTTNAPDGWVYYNGKAIRQDLFLDYLNSQERPTDLNSDYWQRQIFVRGAAKNMEALAYGVTNNDRDALPIFLTPAMLELMGTNRTMAEWEELLRYSWGYLWDPDEGGWVKRVDDGGTGGRTGGGDYSGRRGYGGRPRRATSSTRSGGGGGGLSAYARGKGSTPIRGERRGLPGVGNQSQVSWRI